MKNKRLKWYQKRRLLRHSGTAFFSFLLALLIFMTVVSGDGAHKGTSNGNQSSTFSNVIENVPINFKYDSSEYYISGYAAGVTVTLTSSNRVNLTAETDKSTRNFQVTADLTNLKEGTSRVQLLVHKLPAGMTAKVAPNTVTVTIGKKATKTFSVEAEVPKERIAKGYEVKETKVDVSKVKVTSNETTIQQIDHIRASLPEDESDLSDDYEGEVNLQAVDSNGNVLAATIEPETANLSVDLSPVTKKVPIKVKMTGTMDSSISNIDYTVDQTTATLQGDQAALDKISELEVPIDISNVKENTKKTVKLTADGVSVSPEKIELKLQVTKK